MDSRLILAAAAAVFWVHIAIIAFNLFGLVAIPLGGWRGWRFVRGFGWRALHLGCLAIVAVQALLGRACFLTLWESALLARAGAASSDAPLIQRWVARLVFWPVPMWVFVALYVAVCLYAAWLWWLVPPKLPGA